MAVAVEHPRGPDPDTVVRAQRAFLAVSELDRVLLTGYAGKLQPFFPLNPFHGVDRAYAWEGIGLPHFVQVAAASVQHSGGRYEWRWPADNFKAYRDFSVIGLVVDPNAGCLQDPVWTFRSTTLRRIAYRTHTTPYTYWVSAAPTGHDRFSPYRGPLSELWQKLARSPAADETLASPFPELARDQGAIYEHLVAAELIRQSRGRFALYRPGMDIFGRDLLVHLSGTWRSLFVQIKGTIRTAQGSSIVCQVRRWTFRPADDFWLAFYFFDVMTGIFWKYCWLVPSLEFAALTADQHSRRSITFQVTLEGENNRWRKFRHPIGAQAAALRKALLSLSR